MTDAKKWNAAIFSGMLEPGGDWRERNESAGFLAVACIALPSPAFFLSDYEKPAIKSGDSVAVQYRWDDSSPSPVFKVKGGASDGTVAFFVPQLKRDFVAKGSVHRILLVQFTFEDVVSRYRFSMNGFAELFRMCRSRNAGLSKTSRRN